MRVKFVASLEGHAWRQDGGVDDATSPFAGLFCGVSTSCDGCQRRAVVENAIMLCRSW